MLDIYRCAYSDLVNSCWEQVFKKKIIYICVGATFKSLFFGTYVCLLKKGIWLSKLIWNSCLNNVSILNACVICNKCIDFFFYIDCTGYWKCIHFYVYDSYNLVSCGFRLDWKFFTTPAGRHSWFWLLARHRFCWTFQTDLFVD